MIYKFSHPRGFDLTSSSSTVTLVSLRFGAARGRMPPIGPLYLAAALQTAGVSWRLVDLQQDAFLDPFAAHRLAQVLDQLDSPIIAISLFNDAVPLTIAALRMLGDRVASKKFIVGGPGAVGAAESLLRASSLIDAVVVGEGEEALPLYVLDRGACVNLRGVHARNSMGWCAGTGRGKEADLESATLPPWDWCRDRGYDLVPHSSARGCPFDCAFCEVIAHMGRRVRSMSVDRSIGDLRNAMTAIGSKDVYVLDDTFTLNKKRVFEFCDAVERSGLSMGFSVYSRVDTISEAIAERLASVGCRRMFFGIDGADDRVLAQVSKHLNIAMAMDAVRMTSRHMEVTASFIWGYPFESVESVEKVVDTANELLDEHSAYPITPQLHLLSPSVGTQLFRDYAKEMILDVDAPVLPLGHGLRDVDSEGCEEVHRVIANDRVLGSAFYRFQTPGYNQKLKLIAGVQSRLDRLLASAVLECASNDQSTRSAAL